MLTPITNSLLAYKRYLLRAERVPLGSGNETNAADPAANTNEYHNKDDRVATEKPHVNPRGNVISLDREI